MYSVLSHPSLSDAILLVVSVEKHRQISTYTVEFAVQQNKAIHVTRVLILSYICIFESCIKWEVIKHRILC
jgi:hypothetical protein